MKPTAKIIVISALLAFCSTSLADELLVPSQYSTIQSAIDAAVDGDAVIVAPGTYTGDGNRDIDFPGKAITVRSESGPENCIIDCNSTRPEDHQGFYFHSGEDANSILTGFTIINSNGAIWCSNSSPTITNCTITNNAVSMGDGAIHCGDSTAITNCIISDNSSRGIYCFRGSPAITNCTISNNSDSGISCYDSNATITNCTITNNAVSVGNGAIYCDRGSTAITNCIISDNSSSGIYCEQSRLIINNCTIASNTAGKYGGGIYCHSSSSTITGCIITGNSAKYNGGGLAYCIGPITNCTIANNSAEGEGGGLAWCIGPITNCTIANNSAEDVGGGLAKCHGPITNCTITGNSADYDGEGGGLACCDGPITNCTITGNSANYGGGLDVCYGPITNCTITGNSANYGGGLAECDNITNCTITGNSANYGGGLFDCWGSITNCTITGNSAHYYGGGCCAGIISSTITNSVLWGNTAGSGGNQIALVWRDYPLTLMITYSDVQGGLAAMYIESGCSVIWGQGNIDADPCFIELGYWADANDLNIIVEPNDPNATWVDGDYHLKSEGWSWDIKRSRWTYDDVTSRCIDAGNPGSPLGDELLSVPDDPNNIWGQNLRIDMGAFGGTAEASIPPYDWALLADLTNDGIVDLKDFAFQAADWLNSADRQPGDLNRDSLVDISDLALLVEDWLKQTTWH